MTNKFDIIVIGGGHAGIEAISAAVRMNMRCALITTSIKTICKPSCNPSIGGTAKGHIVKEIDALGGVQGILADATGIHFKMLNTSKGPAIWSPRAQIDKDLYPIAAYQYLNSLNYEKNIHTVHNASFNLTDKKTLINYGKNEKKIDIIEDIVVDILIKHEKVIGCSTAKNETLYAKAIILCAGTFLNGKLFVGQEVSYGGRMGELPSDKISDILASYGLEKGRLKTGTPPRISIESINFDMLKIEKGDAPPNPFSYRTKHVTNKIVCYETETNLKTHDVLRTGFDKSPMFTKMIEGTGPRYCPSIEDKINRFAQRNSHKILLEPEGLNTNSVYVNGFSTSLPRDIQLKSLRTVVGLENCKMLSAGYAIEYDYFYPHQNKHTLETKAIKNLFFAGQINGTSGYEEAASQGLIAGINASLMIKNEGTFTLKRSEAYIGVLIDDLVTKGTKEPYRMFTSLAEYRLLMRQDNADERLNKYGFKFKLIPKWQYKKTNNNIDNISNALEDTKKIKIRPEWINEYLTNIDETPLFESTYLYNILKRGKVELIPLLKYLNDNNINTNTTNTIQTITNNQNLAKKLDIEIKYEGYITKQKKEIEYFLENENKIIPNNFDYNKLNSISQEALQKLKQINPKSIGQASRISGVSATDIAILSFYLKNKTKE